jgi:hypothetical protein
MVALITITEANAQLNDVVFPEWDALDDEFKQYYIDQASGWVRLNWSTSDSFVEDNPTFDWDNTLTWPADLLSLVAQYSDSARAGVLYNLGGTGTDSTSPIKRKTVKAGSLEQTLEYAQPETGAGRLTNARLNDQMKALGLIFGAESTSLLRV